LWAADQPASAQILVEVTAIIEHPALDGTRDGVLDALKAAGYQEGKDFKFVYENAQGNTATAVQIARKFVGDKPNVIVPISTASTQAVVSATSDIPIVFSTVTDPLGDISVQAAEITELYVNPSSAEKMGVKVPADVIAQAKMVF